MAHYLQYRETHDVDAWWIESATSKARQQVIATIENALQSFGQVRTRLWGDVVSIELMQAGKTVFSFQIARRAVQLAKSPPSQWRGITVDSLDDLIASKMVALVERGAPRDFLDIYTLCQRGVTDRTQCWNLWEKRQRLTSENPDRRRAELAIRTHLERIELARPLETITGVAERTAAERLRNWFKAEFPYELD
ncbi:MAG: nucleotidyl transferase AbiEii/AbiGii toxin family protein [Chloroflexi bacterium]|nr:nucleotidyl transferase AbiEii/AbiGii toxin family protein [Chloroflexota bacterium]